MDPSVRRLLREPLQRNGDEPVNKKRVKKRYAFTAPQEEPLLLGAVHEGDSLSVATTEPSTNIAPVHDRMPLVLTATEARLRLDP